MWWQEKYYASLWSTHHGHNISVDNFFYFVKQPWFYKGTENFYVLLLNDFKRINLKSAHDLFSTINKLLRPRLSVTLELCNNFLFKIR